MRRKVANKKASDSCEKAIVNKQHKIETKEPKEANYEEVVFMN